MKQYSLRLIVSSAILAAILLGSIFAPVLAPYDPLKQDMKNALAAPSREHLLGTDNLGRDYFSRILYGGRQSILLAFAATALSMLLGCLIGLAAGYYGKAVDAIITTISNIFQGLPGMTLMITVAGLMGPGIPGMLTAIVINSWVGFSRIVRGEVMRLKQECFIDGLKTVGAGDLRILFAHILPNLLGTFCVVFATRVAGVVISVASLSYLGLGLQPPQPDWGVMINDARMYFRRLPILVIAPGVCIFLLSWSVNMLADELRDRFDAGMDSLKNM